MSDEDMFENANQEQVIETMKRGILPHEIQLLYAMSLIGEGNGVFLASKKYNRSNT